MKLLGIKPRQNSQSVLLPSFIYYFRYFRPLLLLVKEGGRSQAKILADVEEPFHGGQTLSVLDEIHVVHILAKGKAHLPG